jgi:hypothetical protein
MLVPLLLMLLAQSPTVAQVQLVRGVSHSRAVRVARHIDEASSRYNIDSRILVAIIRAESNFEAGIKSCWIVLRHRRCEVTCDYGIAQVNELWIKKWKLDAKRLQFDDRYNIMIAARILSTIQKEFGDQEGNWYGRYHSGTPSKRAVYENRLSMFL